MQNHFLDNTVARCLGRSAFYWLYACLDVDDASVVLENSTSKEALLFLAKHAVSSGFMRTTASTNEKSIPIGNSTFLYRHRGVTSTTEVTPIRRVVPIDVKIEGNLREVNCYALLYTQYLSTNLNNSSSLIFEKDLESSYIEWLFAEPTLIESMVHSISKHSSSTVRFTAYKDDVVTGTFDVTGSNTAIFNIVADRVRMTVIGGDTQTLTVSAVYFKSNQRSVKEEEIKSVLFIPIFTGSNQPKWGTKVPVLFDTIDNIKVTNLVTGSNKSSMPLAVSVGAL